MKATIDYITKPLQHKELEQRVAERTIELTKANAQLREEIAERKRLELKVRELDSRYRLVHCQMSSISLEKA